MDLVTLLSVCTLGFDPKIMQGISIVQSEGKPYVYKEGDKVHRFKSVDAVIKSAREKQEQGKAIRIGLMGLEVDLFAETAKPNTKMFEPCINVNIASRRLNDYQEICERKKDSSPETCAVMSYMGGSYSTPDETYLDEIMLGAYTGNLSNPKLDAVTIPKPLPLQSKKIAKVKQTKPVVIKDDIEDTGGMFFDEAKPTSTNVIETKSDEKDSLFFD